MIFDTLKQARNSLLEFVPRLRSKHNLVQLPSGKWTRVLGAPDARCIHMHGNLWRLPNKAE